MKDEKFRGFLERLRAERELIDIRQPVDIRHIATLVDQSEHALFFHNVIGYDMPVVSGIIRTQKRAAMAVEYLVANGIDKKRLMAKGFGETQLTNRCVNGVECSNEEHKQNRRTVFKLSYKEK